MSNETLRSKYVKVSSQEEANKVYDYLESIGETVGRNWNKYNDVYCYVVNNGTKWILSIKSNSRYVENPIEITLSEFLNEKSNTSKFEVGKWYRAKGYSYYGKFSESGVNYFTVSERCISGYVEGKYVFNSGYEWVEATQKQINSFLPDGHPDKISTTSTLKIGQIYYVEDKSGFWMIGESTREGKEESGGSCRSNAIFIDSHCSFRKDEWCYKTKSNSRTFRLATLEEKQWLQACIKAGKYISKNEALQENKLYYKVALIDGASGIASCKKGDIISCENTKFIHCTLLKDNSSGWMCTNSDNFSEIFNTLQEAEEFAKTLVEPIKKEIHGEKTMSSEELLEEAKRRYPIGTMGYSALQTDANPGKVRVDKIGPVDKCLGRTIIWNIQDGDHIGFLYDGGKWAEIISKPKEKYKPKVGDWVIITEKGTSVNNVGDVGEIIDIDNSQFRVFVKGNSIYTGNWSNINQIRKALPHEIPTNEVEHPKTLEESDIYPNITFKPGDKVKLFRKAKSREKGWGNDWVNCMDKHVGQTFEVIRDDGKIGVLLNDECSCYYPHFVLEKMEVNTKGLSDVLERDFDGQIQGLGNIYVVPDYVKNKYGSMEYSSINQNIKKEDDDEGYYKVDTSMY